MFNWKQPRKTKPPRTVPRARSAPGLGPVTLGRNSSFRKLMRAAQRARLPDERIVIIDAAMQKAARRQELYLHSKARRT